MSPCARSQVDQLDQTTIPLQVFNSSKKKKSSSFNCIFTCAKELTKEKNSNENLTVNGDSNGVNGVDPVGVSGKSNRINKKSSMRLSNSYRCLGDQDVIVKRQVIRSWYNNRFP